MRRNTLTLLHFTGYGLEAFRPGTVPSGEQAVIDGGYNPLGGETASGTSGLY